MNERWVTRTAVIVAVLTITAGVIRASAGSRSDDLLLVHGWLQQWLATGNNPYTSSPGVNYPPHAFLLLAPVGLIPRDIVPVVWAVLQAAMAPLTAWWLVRGWPMTRTDQIIVTALVTSWNAVMTGIWMGQFTLLATLCGLRALQQIDRRWAGGFWLCASTFKPHMGVIFVLWAIARGHWRTVAAAGAWGTTLLLALAYSTQTDPVTIVTTWLDVVAWMFGGSSPQRGITEWWGLLEPVLPRASVGLVRIAGSVAGVLVLAFALRRTRAVDRTGRIALAIIAIWSLATLFHRRYDLFLLAPAMAGLWVALRNDPATSRRHWVLWMGVHLALLVDVPWTWQVYYGPHAQPMGPLAWLCVHFDRLLVIGVGVWFWRRYRPATVPGAEAVLHPPPVNPSCRVRLYLSRHARQHRALEETVANFLAVNEHPIERGVRVVAGLALVGLAFTGSVGAWGYIGVVPILTGALGTCPLYTLLGISTCPVKSKA